MTTLCKPDNKILDRYVKPHKKKSRAVEKKDIERVFREADIMLALCGMPRGFKRGALALAHSQIEEKDPLAFFVINNGHLIINPKITRHTKATVDNFEGCLSFPDKEEVLVQRYNKCEVEHDELTPENNFIKRKISLTGLQAKIFQHEIEHLEGKTIYDEPIQK